MVTLAGEYGYGCASIKWREWYVCYEYLKLEDGVTLTTQVKTVSTKEQAETFLEEMSGKRDFVTTIAD